MGLLSRLFKGSAPAVDDQPFDEQAAAFAANPALASYALPEGDEIEGAKGEFGSLGNPIPVNGPPGELIYLNRLRTVEGSFFVYHRTGSVDSDLIPVPLDRFELLSADGSEWRVLYFSMYHPRRSQAVPPGLRRAPWPRSPVEAMMNKTPRGTTSPIEDFPYGLPEAVEEWAQGKYPPEMIHSFRLLAEKILDKLPEDIERPAELDDL